jgi:peptidoglycan/LPS O-acetylase OafA/YrhL
MSSLSGLRGIAALWMMLHHCLLYCKVPLDLQGNSLMPLFFLLSGFSLTVTYGQQHQFHGWPLLRNRLARVLPLLWLTNALAVPLTRSGFGSGPAEDLSLSLIMSYSCTNTLVSYLLGAPLDGPSWTIMTLLFMWMWMPCWFHAAQKKDMRALLGGISSCFYWQMSLVFFWYYALRTSTGFWPAFATATMNPVFRMPVFVMGCYAGLLCLQHEHTPLVWLPYVSFGRGLQLPCPSMCCVVDKNNRCHACYTRICRSGISCHPSEVVREPDLSADRAWWRTTTDRRVKLLIAVTFLTAVVDTIVRYTVHSPGIVGAVWLQACVPFIQLEVIVGLTRDAGQSVSARCLRGSLWDWLGQVSMAIYLVHWLVIFYLCWAVYGQDLPYSDCSRFNETAELANWTLCEDELAEWQEARLMPMWGVAAVPAITLPLAVFLHYTVERPFRILCKTSDKSAEYPCC